MKILFLTPWYPSAKDAMSGLFVQKHVEAVRLARHPAPMVRALP